MSTFAEIALYNHFCNVDDMESLNLGYKKMQVFQQCFTAVVLYFDDS